MLVAMAMMMLVMVANTDDGDAKIVMNNVTVWQCDSVTVWQCDSVTVWQYDSVTVWQRDRVTAWQCDSVTVWQCDSVTTYRWSADSPVPLHSDAHRHEDGAGEADAR